MQIREDVCPVDRVIRFGQFFPERRTPTRGISTEDGKNGGGERWEFYEGK